MPRPTREIRKNKRRSQTFPGKANITEADKLPRYAPLDIPRHVLGRPTSYKPEYGQALLDDAADGYSFKAFAAKIGTTPKTLLDWVERYPDFSEAYSRAKAVRLRSWEKSAVEISHTGGQGSQATMVIFGLKTMGEEAWQEKQVVDLNAKMSFADLILEAIKIKELPPPTIEGEIVDTDTTATS